MRRFFCFTTALITALAILSCSKPESEEQKVIARVNNFNLTLGEFQYQLASQVEFDKDFKLTRQAKRQFLDQLIKKELFIQEAKRLKLDTKKEFRRAIEKYWESTLIKNLLELKGKEIAKKCVVSEEEIADRYNKMKKKNPALPPLDSVREDITQRLKEEKKTKLLEEWIKDLESKAKIEINENLL